MSSRLIHLNGPPGIGKSTLARRYAADHHGVLACDIDVLRTMLGGWREDFPGAGRLIRPVALAVITAHLAQGHDVVLPQLIARDEELDLFEAAAGDAGAEAVHVLLDDSPEAVLCRWRSRPSTGDDWTEQSWAVIEEMGGDEYVSRAHEQVRGTALARGASVLHVREGELEATYGGLLVLLADGSQRVPGVGGSPYRGPHDPLG
jgi:predicted kinase